ncbi:MAG TPA: lysylphosphatidylglycerol synthase transmembrane domain-containing protein [Candidatus Bathyarchaeia archaeon]|nr:lysylphosphatidylglycerol synthase transmembrane domain-containing protein [Candidatus Bathyarchaeia archaeon]
MQIPKPKFTWKMAFFPFLGIIGFFLYIYLFKVDVSGIFATAEKADPLIYSIAILFGLLQVLFFTVSWRVLTNHLCIKMSLIRAYLYVWYGMYVDTIVPAQSISGEVTRTYLLTRDNCGPFGKVVASLYTHRFLGTALNAIALIAGLVLLSFGGNVNPLVFNLIILVAVVIVGILFLMAFLSFKQDWTLKGINWVSDFARKISRGRIKLEKLKEEGVEIAAHFHDSIKEFRHTPKAVAFSLSYLIISWFFSLSIPYLVFISLNHPVSISIIIVTSAIFLAVKSIPVGIPFEVGLPEAVMTTLYISMGIPGALAATATILTRIITLWLFFIIGFGAQQWLELKPALSNSVNTEKIKIDRPL